MTSGARYKTSSTKPAAVKNIHRIRLLFPKNVLLCCLINKGPSLVEGRFRSKGKIHFSKWQPKVWNYEKYFKRRMPRWLMES